MDPRLWHKVAAVSGVAALGLGTYGAHGYKPMNTAYKEVWHTANLYHLVHTAALLAAPITKHPNIFGGLLSAGIGLFRGLETGLAPPSSTSGLSSSSVVLYQANGEANQTTANVKHRSAKATGQNEASKPRRGRPAKKLKVEAGSSSANGFSKPAAKLAPPIHTRQLLIDKARSEIRRKLEEMRR